MLASPGLVVRSECQNGGFTGAFAAVDVADYEVEHSFGVYPLFLVLTSSRLGPRGYV